MKPILSIKETSKYLGLEYKTVYRLVRAGEIPAARLGTVYRIKLTDLESYFEKQKQRVQSIKTSAKKPKLKSTGVERCGNCQSVAARLIGKCESPDCAERLCEACWNIRQVRYCAQHESVRADPVSHPMANPVYASVPQPVLVEKKFPVKIVLPDPI